MKAAETDVIVLCGGLGTRLAAVLPGVPKPMAPVGDKTFLDILLDVYTGYGFKRFILCVGHKAEIIEERVRGGTGREIVISRENAPLGTAGALKLCEPLRRSATSLVMNGDSICDFDPGAMLDFHARGGGPATIALSPAAGRADGGNVAIDEAGFITRFAEKAGTSPLINAGIYALDARVLAEIAPGRPSSLEKETFPALIGRGLRGWAADAEVYDIGTPERLELFRKKRSV